MGELRNDFKKLEADLAISRSVNAKLRYRIKSLDRRSWSTPDCQYSRRECLEITGLRSNINNEDLEEKVLMIFEKLEMTVDSSNVEDCIVTACRVIKKKDLLSNFPNVRMLIKFKG